ncbi:MAG: PQQ-binding-like beta-propeller repeat protein, partial [Planctomycetes bacterium]|nr:PQQ-binding-like beta-propeller repeat protein [Planctomycetota bacterium]
DGSSLGVLRSPAGITTRILVDGDLIVFGGSDGAVRVVDFEVGKVLWAQSIGRTPTDADLAMTGDRVLVAAEGRIVAFDRDDGRELGATETEDRVLGLHAQGGRAFARVRRPRNPKKPVHDVLIAMDASNAGVLWEFELAEDGPGSLGVDGMAVALPTPEGHVVLFR